MDPCSQCHRPATVICQSCEDRLWEPKPWYYITWYDVFLILFVLLMVWMFSAAISTLIVGQS